MAITAVTDISDLILDLDPHTEAYEDEAGTTPASVNGVVGNVPDQVTGDSEDSTVTESTTAQKSTLKEDANGWKYLDFDGSDDHLYSTSFDHAQPITVILVARHRSGGGAYLLGHNSFNVRFFYSGGAYIMHAGADVSAGSRTDNLRVFQCVWNGASSYLSIDGTHTSGNAGTTAAIDLAISGYSVGGVNPASLEVYRVLAYGKPLSTTELTDLYDYLSALYASPPGGGSGDSVSAAYPEGLNAGETFSCTITKVCLQSEGASLSDLKDNIATLLGLLSEGTTLGDSVDNTSTLLSLLSEGGQFGETFSSEPTLSSSVSEQLELGDQSANTGTLQSSVSEQIELSDLNDNQADLNSSFTEGLELGETHQGTTGNFVGVTEGLELSDSSSNVGSLLVSVSELILTGDSETGDVGTTTASYSEGLELSETFDNRADLFSAISETIELSETFVGGIEGTVTTSWTEGLSLSDTFAFITEILVTPLLPSRTLLDRRLIAFNMRGERITYHQFDDKQLSHKTGEYIESFNPTTINKALIGYVDLEMIETSGGKYKKGDRFIKVMSQDLPETPPSLKDQITYDSVKHRIVDFDESADGNVFLLVCRKI